MCCVYHVCSCVAASVCCLQLFFTVLMLLAQFCTLCRDREHSIFESRAIFGLALHWQDVKKNFLAVFHTFSRWRHLGKNSIVLSQLGLSPLTKFFKIWVGVTTSKPFLSVFCSLLYNFVLATLQQRHFASADATFRVFCLETCVVKTHKSLCMPNRQNNFSSMQFFG